MPNKKTLKKKEQNRIEFAFAISSRKAYILLPIFLTLFGCVYMYIIRRALHIGIIYAYLNLAFSVIHSCATNIIYGYIRIYIYIYVYLSFLIDSFLLITRRKKEITE